MKLCKELPTGRYLTDADQAKEWEIGKVQKLDRRGKGEVPPTWNP